MFSFGGKPPFSILLHFHSTNAILLVATFYHIMLLCSPHRTATPSTQGESDNPASEHQPVTQVAETDQTRYKVHSDCSFNSTFLLSMACPNRVVLHIEITSPLFLDPINRGCLMQVLLYYQWGIGRVPFFIR